MRSIAGRSAAWLCNKPPAAYLAAYRDESPRKWRAKPLRIAIQSARPPSTSSFKWRDSGYPEGTTPAARARGVCSVRSNRVRRDPCVVGSDRPIRGIRAIAYHSLYALDHPDHERRYLTVSEVAAELACSEPTVRRRIRTGQRP